VQIGCSPVVTGEEDIFNGLFCTHCHLLLFVVEFVGEK